MRTIPFAIDGLTGPNEQTGFAAAFGSVASPEEGAIELTGNTRMHLVKDWRARESFVSNPLGVVSHAHALQHHFFRVRNFLRFALPGFASACQVTG